MVVDWIDTALASVTQSPEQQAHEKSLLLSHVGHGDEPRLREFLRQRVEEKIPMEYLVGETTFFDMRFFVRANDSDPLPRENGYMTYRPRRETEILVQRAIEYGKSRTIGRAVDIATGSGCIAISVKKHLPATEMTAVDVSPQALAVAKRNAMENQTDIRFLQGSWFDPVLTETFDLILCNPPYVPVSEREQLSQEALHEPFQAHNPGEAPDEMFRHLLQNTQRCLAPDGAFFFEIGFGQFKAESLDVSAFSRDLGFEVSVEKDLDGVDRFLYGRFA